MGKVMQKIKLTSYTDVIRAQDGHLAPELIRSRWKSSTSSSMPSGRRFG
jgi:hypothetical protein